MSKENVLNSTLDAIPRILDIMELLYVDDAYWDNVVICLGDPKIREKFTLQGSVLAADTMIKCALFCKKQLPEIRQIISDWEKGSKINDAKVKETS